MTNNFYLLRRILLLVVLFTNWPTLAQNTFRFIDLNSFKWGVMDTLGKIIIEPKYTNIAPLKFGRYCVSESAMVQGLIDENGNELLDCRYSSIYNIAPDTLLVSRYRLSEILNTKMDPIVPQKYKYLLKIKDFHIVGEDKMLGVLNADLRPSIPMMYTTIYHPNTLDETYFLAEQNRKRGLIDINNNIIIPVEYDFLAYNEQLKYFVGGQIANGREESQTKVFDINGKLVFYKENNGLEVLTKNRFAIKNDKKQWAVFDENAKQLTEFKFNRILSSGKFDSIFIVQNDQLKWGAIDENGNTLIPFQFMENFYFKQDAAYVKNNKGKYAFINKKGTNITAFIFDKVESLSTGFYRAQVERKSAIFDLDGNELIAPYYDFINAPINNFVNAIKDKKYYLLTLNKDTNIIMGEYEYIANVSESKDFILVKQNGLYGFINYEGKVVVPIIYENARPFMDDFASVKYKNDSYIINKKGERKWKMKKR